MDDEIPGAADGRLNLSPSARYLEDELPVDAKPSRVLFGTNNEMKCVKNMEDVERRESRSVGGQMGIGIEANIHIKCNTSVGMGIGTAYALVITEAQRKKMTSTAIPHSQSAPKAPHNCWWTQMHLRHRAVKTRVPSSRLLPHSSAQH
jgi:hypothetical protein